MVRSHHLLFWLLILLRDVAGGYFPLPLVCIYSVSLETSASVIKV